MKLRVCHFPQVPCKPFIVEIENEREAYLLENALAVQHLFLYQGNFIPDFSNAVIVEMWDEENKEWCDYYNEDAEQDWDEYCEEHFTPIKHNYVCNLK